MSARGWIAIAAMTIGAAATAVAIVVVTGRNSAPQAAGPIQPRSHRAAWQLAPAVAATFVRSGYRAGSTARLVLWHKEPSFTVQLFRIGADERGWNRTTMQGTPVSPVYRFGSTPAHRPVPIRIGDWPSGVYFARLQSGGLAGFAPFVVTPRRPGTHHVLVVEPSFTWQAYNFRDDNDDGRGDTWYDSSAVRTVRLDRPFLSRGVPPHFTTYDLRFLEWLARTGRRADFVSDEDLDTPTFANALSRYRLVVFPGHEEYVTPRMYDAVTRYRDGGGHLMFLSADNFYWRVILRGPTITRTQPWRALGRPEASLVGVQLWGNDRGSDQGPWRVVNTKRWPWLFAGTGLHVGSKFGYAGIEIDHIAKSSPPGTTIVARIPGVIDRNDNADMTFYQTSSGAEVFAAGAFTLAGSRDAASRRLVANLWNHLATSRG